MKVWFGRPSHDEVRADLETFFRRAVCREARGGRGMVPHAQEDWNENVYNLF